MATRIEYVTARFPESEMVRSTDRRVAMRRLYGFIGRDDARVRLIGRSFGEWRSAKLAKERVALRSHTMPLGEKLVVQRRHDGAELSVRKIAMMIVPDLNAYPELEVVHALQLNEFPGLLRSGGIWYCRTIDGTNIISKHGYKDRSGVWLGAAEDLFVTSGGMDQLKEVAKFTVSLYPKRAPHLATVIVERDIWRPGGWSFGGYGGATHYHQHEDFNAGVPCR
jgi:hypothetical protein